MTKPAVLPKRVQDQVNQRLLEIEKERLDVLRDEMRQYVIDLYETERGFIKRIKKMKTEDLTNSLIFWAENDLLHTILEILKENDKIKEYESRILSLLSKAFRYLKSFIKKIFYKEI